MRIGTQIIAPEGWGQLIKGIAYHFLRSDARRERVLLVQFETGENFTNPKAHLIVVPRPVFEEGAGSDQIIPTESQSYLPPWLVPLEGADLSQVDRFRPNAKVLHSTRVENRFLFIYPAVRDFDSILGAADPQAEINRRATSCIPPQNETRFRLWFLTYLCFGQDVWMLLPPFHTIGHWDRFAHPEKKYGAPSLAYGAKYGNGCSPEMAERCVKSYLARAALGKHMSDIYSDAMTNDFHCRTSISPAGMTWYWHPQGKPFPTYWQFKYRVQLAIGIETIQKALYGEVRHRTRIAASKGSFSEEVANLLERIEADAYNTKERPRGYIEGSSLPHLCVVIGRDVLSGKKLGIGFSFGAERNTAYRFMLFCMAVPKDFFCSLFGVPFVPGEWVNEGLPGHFGIDRGPGARKNLIAELQKRFPIRDLAPSWSGQSKATVESSHPKDVKIEGQPTFFQSELTPVELAKREIMKLMRFNNTADMEARFDPDSELAHVTPNPMGLWMHYDKLFRNDGQPMSIDEAVRTFLTPMKFSLREDGVWLGQRRFTSDELKTADVLDRIARSGDVDTKIDGYVLDMCVRHIWVEVDGQLLLLTAKLRIRGDKDSLDVCLEELNQWSEARRKVVSAYRVHQKAASSEYMDRFQQDTGKAWDAGRRRSGKPKRTATARQEEMEARQTTPEKSAA